METPDTLMYIAVGAFVLGFVVAKVSGAIAGTIRTKKRDPRDDRIRNLDAELRIAQSDAAKAKDEFDKQVEDVNELRTSIESRDLVITELQEKIARLRADLKDSVKKTRELRSELSERAEENVRSEVKLREVETELSVAQASTDLIATGVLDYSVAPETEDARDDDDVEASGHVKAAT